MPAETATASAETGRGQHRRLQLGALASRRRAARPPGSAERRQCDRRIPLHPNRARGQVADRRPLRRSAED